MTGPAAKDGALGPRPGSSTGQKARGAAPIGVRVLISSISVEVCYGGTRLFFIVSKYRRPGEGFTVSQPLGAPSLPPRAVVSSGVWPSPLFGATEGHHEGRNCYSV